MRNCFGIYGAPGTTRTCDLLVRSQTLYPTELRARLRVGRSDFSMIQSGHADFEVSPGEFCHRYPAAGREKKGKMATRPDS